MGQCGSCFCGAGCLDKEITNGIKDVITEARTLVREAHAFAKEKAPVVEQAMTRTAAKAGDAMSAVSAKAGVAADAVAKEAGPTAKTAAAKVGELVDAANAHAADAAGAAKVGATPATQQLGEAARGVSAGVNEGLGVKPREP